MDNLEEHNEEQTSLSKREKNRQKLKEILSFFLSIGLFVLMIYVTFHLVAYITILYPNDYMSYEQQVRELQYPDIVDDNGLLGIFGLCVETYCILPLLLLYLYVKLSKKLTSKIINHLIKVTCPVF